MKEENKAMIIYVLNHYVGGTPMDGECLGVFDTLEQANDNLFKTLEQFDIEEEHLNWGGPYDVYWDLDDYWGGLEIEVLTLNKIK